MNEHTIELYVLKKTEKREIQFMKGSDAVPIRFVFRDFGIPEGATATYFVQKPSGAQVHDECEIDRNNNSVVIRINKQMVAEEGLMYIQIHVSIEGKDLITFGHPYRVYGSEIPIESETYMPLIDAKITEATTAIESANAAAQRAETVAEAAAQGLFSSTIQIGTVTTVEPTEQATVTNSGSDQHPVFDFNIPQGLPGTTVPVTTDLGINTPGTYAADASIAKAINDRLTTIENVSTYPEEAITEDTKLLREHDGVTKKGTVASLLDIIKNKITSWTFNIGTTNKTVPGAIDELNSKTEKSKTQSTSWFSTTIGSSIQTYAYISISKRGRVSDNSYIFDIRIDGRSMGSGSSDQWRWLNFKDHIDVRIANMLGVSVASCSFEQTGFGSFRICEILNRDLWNYTPLVSLDTSDGSLRAGRIYTEKGAFGSYAMANIDAGYFGLDISIKVTTS